MVTALAVPMPLKFLVKSLISRRESRARRLSQELRIFCASSMALMPGVPLPMRMARSSALVSDFLPLAIIFSLGLSSSANSFRVNFLLFSMVLR